MRGSFGGYFKVAVGSLALEVAYPTANVICHDQLNRVLFSPLNVLVTNDRSENAHCSFPETRVKLSSLFCLTNSVVKRNPSKQQQKYSV